MNRVMMLVLAAALVVTAPAAARAEIKSYTFAVKDGRTVEVYYCLPESVNGDTKVLFALHGANRDGKGYINLFRQLARSDSIAVITPEFTVEQFNVGRYQAIGIGGNIDAPENWTPKIIDAIFLDFRERFNLSAEKYIMQGFSAGGQFTHRAVMFSESEYLDYAIATGAGQYTFPDDQVNYNPGVKNVLHRHKELIHKNFGRRMYIAVGDRDNDPECHCLPRGEAFMRQGRHRLERALNFYQASRDYCEVNGLPFNWELVIMKNTGHAAGVSYVRGVIMEESGRAAGPGAK